MIFLISGRVFLDVSYTFDGLLVFAQGEQNLIDFVLEIVNVRIVGDIGDDVSFKQGILGFAFGICK